MKKKYNIFNYDFFFVSAMMILGHGANTMTLDEARIKLCAQAK
jgi:hypothetical protein